jgi:glycosyltransferase involved in cell wall biosynthesis
MTTLYINGKFTAQSMTGVQRVAHETVQAIDRLLEGRTEVPRCVLVCPPGARPPTIRNIEIRKTGRVKGNLALWEQVALPVASRDGLLLNLSGSAPWVAAGRSVCLMHDAAVFDHPEAYKRAFRIWYRLLFRRLARDAGALLTVSEFSRQRLVNRLGVPPERLRVVHNGADHFDRITPDLSVLQAYGLEPGKFLLVVGTEKKTKNIQALLDAWRALPREPGQVLVWVGGVNSRVFSSGQSGEPAQPALSDGILRIGVVPDARLKALYRTSAGLIIPSTYEGFGFPAVEAMSCGCPVAAAKAAALPEICGGAAVYFDPKQPASIGETMRSLLEDEALRTELSAKGHAQARLFSWDSSARAVASCLEELTLQYSFAQ